MPLAIRLAHYQSNYNRQMSIQSRRGSAVIRQVLKEVINTDHPNSKRFEDIEKAKLNEIVGFLEKKIDRQHSEIKVISEQLSREITLKEELLLSLNEEREKNGRLNQHLAAANRNNHELKSRVVKSKVEATASEKEEFDVKINKYREIVRKKDELLTKNQQKLQELLKNQRTINQLEHQLKSLRESFGKLKGREENLAGEVQRLKQKISQGNDRIKQKDDKLKEIEGQLKDRESRLLFADEHLRRMKAQYQELMREHEQDQEACRLVEEKTKRLLEQQAEEIKRLTERSVEPFSPEVAKWDLGVFKKEVKRILESVLKDPNLRKKIEKEMVELLSEVELSFTHVVAKIFESK